jgi:predicted transcriptional regulator
MLDHVSRSKRRPKIRYVQPRWPQERAELPGPPQREAQLTPPEVLERIEQARLTREKADAELATLVDQAVGMGIGWPEIAARLDVTRQAARQHYQRRHRHDASRQDRVA